MDSFCFAVPWIEGAHYCSIPAAPSGRWVVALAQLAGLALVRRRGSDLRTLVAWVAVVAVGAAGAPIGGWWIQFVRAGAWNWGLASRCPALDVEVILLASSLPLWCLVTQPHLTTVALRFLLLWFFATSLAFALRACDVPRLGVACLLCLAQGSTIALNEPVPSITFGVVAWCWALLSRCEEREQDPVHPAPAPPTHSNPAQGAVAFACSPPKEAQSLLGTAATCGPEDGAEWRYV